MGMPFTKQNFSLWFWSSKDGDRSVEAKGETMSKEDGGKRSKTV